jgi:DNA polymerase bacteriophage-type
MFPADRLVFIDFETRSEADIKVHGAASHVALGYPIVLAYAIGDGKVITWHANGQALPNKLPADLAAAYGNKDTIFVAWNMSFDRAVWNQSFHELLRVEDTIDAMAQALAYGLPAGLDDASKAIGGPGKDKRGRQLIRMFSSIAAPTPPDPDDWRALLDYAGRDVEELRRLYRATRPLSETEWQCYWAAEHINIRGIGIDVELVKKANQVAQLNARDADMEIRRRTGFGMNQVARLASWAHELLPCDARAVLEKILPEAANDEENDERQAQEPAKQLTRNHISRLLLRSDLPANVRRVLELRQYGGGSSPKKFASMLAQQRQGRLYNQFQFNGAAQTGRFAGRGVQLQNLTRGTLDEVDGRKFPGAEHQHLCRLDEGADLALMQPFLPTSRKLALLVRPMLAASPGRYLVWCDWSQIEARVLPWLAMADERLAIFRDIDTGNPDAPDLYTRSAAAMLGIAPTEVSKPQRQTGKVAELALGFGGGVGALQRMATAYGLTIDDPEAVVKRWRRANVWAVRFWDDLWQASLQAWRVPGPVVTAGRVGFRFDPRSNRMWLMLPSGRPLCYHAPRQRYYKNKDDTKPPEMRWTFRRPHGLAPLWHGTYAENITQAVAADVLRQSLRRLDQWGTMDVVGHVHDEIIVECHDDYDSVEDTKANLRYAMTAGFEWSRGLPLAAAVSHGYYYSKTED